MTAVASDPLINAKVQQINAPTEALVLKSGSQLVLESGATLYVGGTDVTSAVATGGIAGVAAGYKLARGSTALDGSNPTPVTTGLASCIAAVACLKGTAAPGDGTSVLTTNIGTADFDCYAWKNTGGTDPTLVASTGTESFYWIAVGT